MKNPPAFPGEYYVPSGIQPDQVGPIEKRVSSSGMSLLDHFAGLAMQGMSFSTLHGSGAEEFFQAQIRMAYKVARAMLEERAKPENQL